MSETITTALKLEVQTPKPVGGGLAETIAQLKEVDALVGQVNARLAGLKAGPGAARSVKELEGAIKALQVKGGGLKSGDLAKGLGLDPGDFDKFLARQRKSLKDYKALLQEFRSAPAAAKAVSRYEREAVQMRRLTLGSLLTPSGGGGAPTVNVKAGAVTVDGTVPLIIPASQIQASVAGVVNVAVAGGPQSGGPGGATAGRGGIGRKKGAKGPLNLPPGGNEFQRVRTETHDALREVITEANALGEVIATTHDSVEGIIKTVTRKRTGTAPLAEFQKVRRLEEEAFKTAKSGLATGDYKGLAVLQQKQATALRAILTPDLGAALGKDKASEVKSLLEEKAKTLEAQAGGSLRSARQVAQAAADKDFERRKRDARANVQSERELAAKEVKRQRTLLEAKYSDSYRTGRGVFFTEMGNQEEARARRLEAALLSNPLASARQKRSTEADILQARANVQRFAAMGALPGLPAGAKGVAGMGAVPPVIKGLTPTGNTARLMSGLQAFTPMGMLANLTKVAGWATAVTILYKSIELATYALHRFVQVGAETAHLAQVFRGVGGSVQALTEDLVKLAVSNGRTTEEAMESGREWARLGLNRKDIGEAVGVSMVATNVAPGLTSKEATEHLSSLMHIYGLEVRDLNGVLGMLVSTSNRYNVTVEQLFQGLDRAAGVAKQAGMSLAELQGILGATVGKTGQSGVVVGNTIKSILVQFNNPEIQKFLRGYGVETTTAGGEQKSGSQVLRELFVRYQGLSDSQRQHLTMRVAGRLQGGRFVGMMDSYVEGQKLAIESQLHLNSAQEANAKILGTMKAQMAGVVAEFDRLIVAQTGRKTGAFGGMVTMGGGLGMTSMNDALVGILRGGKNAIRTLNQANLPLGEILFPWMSTLGSAGNLITHFTASKFEKGQDRFENEMQRHDSAAAAYVQRGELFETMGKVLKVGRPEELAGMADNVASQMGQNGPAFKKSVNAGDMDEAQRLLNAEAATAHGQGAEEMRNGIKSRVGRISEAIEERNRLSGMVDKQKELAEVNKEIAELQSNNSQAAVYAAQEDEGATGQAYERRQEYVTLLKEQEAVMRELGNLSTQQSAGTAGGQLDAELSTLNQQIDNLKKAKDITDRRGGINDVSASTELQQQITDAEVRKGVLESPRMRTLTNVFDARQIAIQRAQQEAASYAVGYGEGDKLLNQRSGIQGALNRLRPQRGQGITENDAVRAKELEIQLWKTQEAIQARVVDLSRQERQIRLDSTREFQRALLLAGPGEQLQRLHVAQLMRKPGGVGAGEFMALSPELKRMMFEASGGEQGVMVRHERNRLRGQGLTVEQQQMESAATRGRVSDWATHLNDVTQSKLAGMAVATPLPLEVKARNAALQLGALATALSSTKMIVDQVNAALLTFRSYLNIPAPAAHPGSLSLDISPGFGLGSMEAYTGAGYVKPR